jgi:hypothetical protein
VYVIDPTAGFAIVAVPCAGWDAIEMPWSSNCPVGSSHVTATSTGFWSV